MENFTAILVDDEISNLKGLQLKIEKLFPDIKITGAFQKPEVAIERIAELKPNILFLDIQMPRMNGFELLSKLKAVDFQVIFVTAYSDYAIAAFKQNAVDYILKPIENDHLKTAIDKAIEVLKQKNKIESNEKLVNVLTQCLSKNNKIIVPTSLGVSFIPQEEVMHLEGFGGYTKIHLVEKKTIISSYNIGKFEKLLDATFFKCHKSHIINLEKVRHFEKEGYIVLDNHYRVPISKTNKKAFLGLFN